MAVEYKILGQSAPSATTETDLYTVPSGVAAVCSTLVVCNRGAATTFRVTIAAAGAATANEQYLYYDVAIAANDTFAATIGITIPSAAVVRIYAGTANLSFSLFGSEVS